MGMYEILLGGIVAYIATILIVWKIMQNRMDELKELIKKQETMIKKNLPEIKEEYARIFREIKKEEKKSAREVLGV